MPRHTVPRRARYLALVLLFAATTVACTPAPPPTASSLNPVFDPATDYVAAAAAARALRTVDRTDETPPYARASFGEPWEDVDGNGCSQRQDVLARDLADVEVAADGCTVLRGTIARDAYSGRAIPFEHDRVAADGAPGSRAVQIDHIVSLSAAHAGGAWRWPAADRVRFANDPANLAAVDGVANEAKGSLGPARWMPARADTVCPYVAAYTRVATAWDLAVRDDDRDRLVTTLESCR